MLNVSTGTYAPLTGATNLATTYPWDDPSETVPIGFTFASAFGLNMTDLSFDISFGGAVSNGFTFPSSQPRVVLSIYDADLMDRGYLNGVSQSAIRYKTEGMAPNRIFKLEWENAGFYGEYIDSNQLNDFVNVQLWLYEQLGTIEFRYGPSSIQAPISSFEGETGPTIGIADVDFTAQSFNDLMILIGAPANPSIATTEAGITGLNGTPANGTIYRFEAATISTESHFPVGVRVYPNPVQDFLNVALPGFTKTASCTLSDIAGNVLLQAPLQQETSRIYTAHLASGIYLFTLKIDGQTTTHRLVK